MPVKSIPEGYHTVTPHLIIKGAAEAIEFYKKALGATEVMRLPGPEGKVMHAEIQIGDSKLMLADEFPDCDILGPASRGGTTVSFAIYVKDCDSAFERAIAAGGVVQRPVENQFYGDRSGTFKDPYGHQWTLSTHVEDVSEEEMRRRMEGMMQAQS